MSNRMKGHALIGEGAPHDDNGNRFPRLWGGTNGDGRAKCSCGELSPVLGSGIQRKRWHRDHKERLRKESKA